MKRSLACSALVLLLSCGRSGQTAVAARDYAQPTPAGYATVPADVAGPRTRFTEVAAASGIQFRHQTGAVGAKLMPETMGSGCALFDYDGDGWLDVFLVNSRQWDAPGAGERPRCALFRNQGNGRFADVSGPSGLGVSVYGMGAAVADYDGDGDPDLYLTCLGRNLLMRNDRGRFTDVAAAAGVAGSEWTDDAGRTHPEWSTTAAWVDYDRDGWPDLFVSHYVRWSPQSDLFTTLDGSAKSYATPQPYPGSSCRLYRNRGDGSFVEVTRAAGIETADAKALGVAVADLDRDGWSDLVVTNDTQPNLLFHNRGDGRFEERGLASGIAYDDAGRARAGMGVDAAVLAGDGHWSIAIGNFSREPVSLYQQVNERAFVDGAGKARLVQATLPALTFGLRFVDFDLDGRQDLVLANGHIEPTINRVQKEIQYAQLPQLFWNDGQGHLLDVTATSGPAFAEPLVARGLAVGDVDRDGDLDILLTTNGGPPRLLRNEGPTGRAVALRLHGRPPATDALAAVVSARVGDQRQEQTVYRGSSYLSHSATSVYLGVGVATAADGVSVRWPDGTVEELGHLAAGTLYDVSQGRGVSGRQAFTVAVASR